MFKSSLYCLQAFFIDFNAVFISILQEIPNVTRKYQNYVVKCEAQNVVGLSADSETLDVICMYAFLSHILLVLCILYYAVTSIYDFKHFFMFF